jgi:hypothetical protein
MHSQAAELMIRSLPLAHRRRTRIVAPSRSAACAEVLVGGDAVSR